MTTVGILGLGRIGRSLVRILHGHPRIRIGAIRDVAEPDQLAYLLKYDTILGRFPEPVSIEGGDLRVGDRRIRVLAGKSAPPTSWGELGVDTVLESTSQTRSRAELAAHLDAGARRVIACGHTAEPPDLLAVAGLSEARPKSSPRIISIGSQTVQCAAPALAILRDAFGLRRAVLTAIHSYTSAQHLADAPADDFRRGRAAAENIIPQASRSVGMLTALLPDLAQKLSAFALNVPAFNGSAVDLVCWHERDASVEDVRAAFRAAASRSPWSGTVEVTEDPIVSSDVARTRASCVFDALAAMALPGRVSKSLLWFDAGYSFAQRAVDAIEQLDAAETAA